jgi:hypothetical protein
LWLGGELKESVRWFAIGVTITLLVSILSLAVISHYKGCDKEIPPLAILDAKKDCLDKGLDLGGFRRTNWLGTSCEWYCVDKGKVDEDFSVQILT